jgi:hypothetical protein
MRPQDPDGSRIAARWELERQHDTLCALARSADAAVATLLGAANDGGWRGPASWAFEIALGTLRREASGAVDALRAAQRMTQVALDELDHGV